MKFSTKMHSDLLKPSNEQKFHFLKNQDGKCPDMLVADRLTVTQ